MAVIVFGAFDRHNFGDLLFPHIVAALLPQQSLRFAGLLARDLRSWGGHQVEALPQLAAALQEPPLTLIHAGGEVLTCEAWQAAVMLLPEDDARRAIACLEAHPNTRAQWACDQLHSAAHAPYIAPRALFPRAEKIIYNGVGGVDLARCPPAMQAEVLAHLAEADAVSVRDQHTQASLRAAGIDARLIPDPAVMTAELFGDTIRQHGLIGEPARFRQRFPQGYLAVQCSADFGDETTLATLAAQVDRVASDTGYGICFFRAGAAPWHDALSCYQQLAARMHSPHVALFSSLHLWDICALIAGSRGYCGSSLHGRIVATAFALPRISLLHAAQAHRPGKQSAYAAAWEAPGLPLTCEAPQLAQGLELALAAPPEQLRQHALQLAARYRREFATICPQP